MEGLSKAALIKSLSPRVMLSNHLLPKGTKMKVNLEDQGRQKVSFSFAQTKKPLQSLFFIPPSPEKSVTEPLTASSSSDRGGQSTDSKTEQQQRPTVPTSTAETLPQTPVSSAAKLKTDLAKMHFKKQILSVSVIEEKPAPAVPGEPNSASLPIIQHVPEFPSPQPQNAASVCSSENAHTDTSEKRETPSLKKQAAPSGKDGDSSSSAEQDSKVYKRKTRSQSDSAPPGSESDGDSAQMSSSHRSMDSKSKTNSESRCKEVKKSSSGSHAEEKERSSSRRSENHERSSSYSKSDRDSRHTSSRSSRSDKDRRRSRSRTRSRSRGSRTSSSHSRSERSRGDRGSRSERSYYHDSDRRSHRSSPRRERRRSRSRTDRTRDSSESEDDYRKTRTRTSDSSRSSTHGSTHKESKSSYYSKSEKVSKLSDSPHPSELDKKMQSSKSERTSSKRLSDSDKCSPDHDSSYRKSSSHHKSETSSKSSSSSVHTQSQTYEKRQKSNSSDSEVDHKAKSQTSEKSSSSDTNYQKRSSRSDSKQMTPSRSSVKNSGQERQSSDTFQSPVKEPSVSNTPESSVQSKKEKSDPQQCGNEQSNWDLKEIISCTDKSLQELSSQRKETKPSLEVETENASAISSSASSESLQHVNASLENLTQVKDSPPSNNRPHVKTFSVVTDSFGSDESVICSQEKKAVEPQSLLDTYTVQQNTKMEVDELTTPLTVNTSHTSMPLQSDSSCLKSEDQLTLQQQNTDSVKKSSSGTKKSRWDIVGQDNSEGDHIQRTLCAESKPTVKKIISVKKIELSKDSEVRDMNQQDNETHSELVKHTEKFEHQVDSDSTSMAEKYKDQSEPSQASTSMDHCDLQQSAFRKTNTGQSLHRDASDVQSWNGGGQEENYKMKAHKSKMNKRTSLNPDASGGQSEASDSDNSEYDSDCGEAIKRLHSVVVVPKNSSLTMDAHDTQASSCTSVNSSELQNADTAADLNISEVPKQRQENPSAASMQTSGPCGNESSSNIMLCQSQSNMVDSTSHPESSSFISAQAYMVAHSSAHGSTKNLTPHLNKSGQYEEGHKQHEKMYPHYRHDDLSGADNVNDRNRFNHGWDFSQSAAEQPSSTYQQPDSSHGPQLLNTKLTGTPPIEQGHMQSNISWNHESSNMHISRKPYLLVHQDPSGEIHPDSLTNDHGDYSDKPSSLSKMPVECSRMSTLGSSSFVQGYEISSNSKGSIVPDLHREDAFRPHRGRGPPKKRRPEIESDSDNEAEAGPAAKRGSIADADISKDGHVKAEVQLPSLTLQDFQDSNKWKEQSKLKKMPPYFDLIEENLYLTER